MGAKNFLAYTNPITWIVGIPVLCGIVVSVILNNVVKNTAKVVKSVNEDVME